MSWKPKRFFNPARRRPIPPAAHPRRSHLLHSIPLEKDIDQLIIGKTNKAQVIKIIGPAAISDDASWIYISSNVKSTAFFDPAVTDRNILFLEFSKKDILSSREIFTVEDGKFFNMHKTKEINDPRKINAFKQLFGNIGNFSAESFVDNY